MRISREKAGKAKAGRAGNGRKEETKGKDDNIRGLSGLNKEKAKVRAKTARKESAYAIVVGSRGISQKKHGMCWQVGWNKRGMKGKGKGNTYKGGWWQPWKDKGKKGSARWKDPKGQKTTARATKTSQRQRWEIFP